ncbi:MAG: hypothetical protein M3Y54_05095 [Bacteroidota bacterium]|nr:hypothetical protein [Bacteroidota bacterium]
MKPFSLLILGGLCLAACQSNPAMPAAEVAAPAAIPPAPTKTKPSSAEHIDAGMLTVTGLPDEELTTKQLTRQLGRPDSIAKGAVECGSRLSQPMNSPAGDFWYYGKTMYEVSGTRAILASFNVRSGKFQGKLGKLVLNQNTTLEDVRRFFPVSAKQADVPAVGRAGEEITLPFFHDGTQTDASLILLFKKGQLQSVEFFQPC